MENIDVKLRKHKFIVFSQDHYNPLNVIRSLGEKGLNPISILYTPKPILINHCRYVSKLHRVSSLEEGYKLLEMRNISLSYIVVMIQQKVFLISTMMS